MTQGIKINDIVTIVRKDNLDRSYQNDLWTITDFNDTHIILKAVKDRGCADNAIIIVLAEYHISRVNTQALSTDQFITKPIDWTGCNPDIKACLQAGLAVQCIDEDGHEGYVTGYSVDGGDDWFYVLDDSDQMSRNAKPISKTVTKTYYKKASEIIAWLEENATYASSKWTENHTSNTWTNEFVCTVAGTLYDADSLSIPAEFLESRTR